jgi:hypothetical protein
MDFLVPEMKRVSEMTGFQINFQVVPNFAVAN